VWYAEADTPTGPWVYMTKIAEHGKYTYYWPVQHPFFDQQGGRVIYFEGTYTDTWSGNPVITPRYNYNQLMYRLSLDDPRLFLPAPVYRLKDGRYLMREGVEAARAWRQVAEIPFFALPRDRRREGAVQVGGLFYAVAPDSAGEPASVAGSWDCKDHDFTLDLRADGERLTAVVSGDAQGTGTLRDGVARFDIRIDGALYHATAQLKSGQLAVEWTGAETDQATCTRAAARPDWRASRALVPLYVYNGVYSTQPRPGARPIARVWRNPLTTLPLDRDAQPLQ
jgi:hypothetical protein